MATLLLIFLPGLPLLNSYSPQRSSKQRTNWLMHHIWILVGTWTQNEKSSSLMSCVCPKMVDKTIFIKAEMRWEAVVASFPLCPTSLTSHAIDFAVLYELWIWLYLFNVPMAVFFFHCQCHWQMPSLLFHIITNSWSTAFVVYIFYLCLATE